MAKKARKSNDALDMDRSVAFLKRERLAQRAGTVVLAGFVVAGAAGVFGGGPVSEATVQSGQATFRFERFTRQTVRTHLEISIDGASGPTVAIRMPREFLSGIDMVDVRPANTLKRLDEENVLFEVPAQSGKAFLELLYEPKKFGVLEADIVAGEQPPARLRQIVFF